MLPCPPEVRAVEGLLVLFGLAVVGSIVFLPIIALISASRARTEARALAEHLGRLEADLLTTQRHFNSEIKKLKGHSPVEMEEDPKPISPLAEELSPIPDSIAALSPPLSPREVSVPPPEARPQDSQESASSSPAEAPSPPPAPHSQDLPPPRPLPSGQAAPRPRPSPSPLPPPRPPRPPASTPSLEFLVGVRGFSWVGAGALFLSAVFALKYSIDVGFWGNLPPEFKIASAILLGVLAVGGAEPLWSRKYRFQAGALAGSGVAVLYAALFAARSIYSLLPPTPTFALMAGVTAVAVGISLRHSSQFVAFLGLMGGFATPILLSTGTDRPVALFSYVLLLNLALLWVAWRGRWVALLAGAGLMTLLLQYGWMVRHLSAGEGGLALALFGLLAVTFAIGSALADRRSSSPPGFTTVATLSALTGLVAALPVMGRVEVGATLGATMVFLALLLGGSLLLSLAQKAAWPATLGALGAGVNLAVWLLSHRSSLENQAPLVVTAVLALLVLPLLARILPLDDEQKEALRPSTLASLLMQGLVAAIAVGVLSEGARTVRPFSGDWGGVPGVGSQGVEAALWALLIPLLYSLLALVITRATAWGMAAGMGLALTVIQYLTWGEMTRAAEVYSWGLPAGGLTVVAYALYPGLSRGKHGDDLAPVVAAALAGPLLFKFLYDIWVGTTGGGAVGLLPIGMGAITLFCAYDLRRSLTRLDDGPRTRNLLIFLAVSLGMAGVAVAVQLEKQWMTIGFALEVVVLALLHTRLAHPLFRGFLSIFAMVVAIRLLLNSAVLGYQERGSQPILNAFLYTYGVPLACFLMAARLLGSNWKAEFFGKIPLPTLLRIGGVAFGFWLVNIEVVDWFTPRGPDLERLRFAIPQDFAPSLAMSLSWAAYGGLLLTLGILRRERGLRLLGLLGFVLAAVKVFLWDIMGLGGLYRVVSFLGMGLALLAAAIAFQKVMRKDGDEESEDEGTDPPPPSTPPKEET